MTMLNLYASDPVLFVDRSTPSELLEAIRTLEKWDEQTLDMANLLIPVWSADAIARPNDREGISELQRLIHSALDGVNSSASLPEEYRFRWLEASDILESRRLNLAHADPEVLLRRRHVPEILQLLLETGNRELPQLYLINKLGVSAGRVTQLIGNLESCGLVTKRKHGRDILLQLTDIGRKHAASAQKTAPSVTGFCGLLSTDVTIQSHLKIGKLIAA